MPKTCPRCGGPGPFGKNRSTKDGLSSWCRSCNRDYAKRRYHADPVAARARYKAWEVANSEKRRALNAKWYSANRQLSIERATAWQKANRERANANLRARRAANPEKHLAESTRWYQQNRAKAQAYSQQPDVKDRRREYNSRWREANRDRLRVHYTMASIKRRALCRGVPCAFTHADWLTILEIFDYRCAYCLRRSKRLHKDHVVALARGGPHTAENIVPACPECNATKKDRPVFMMTDRPHRGAV